MTWNRRKELPEWEKRRIRNRHEKYLRKENRTARSIALFVLVILLIGIVGGVVK